MRCRRLCEKKPSGRYNVDPKIAEQYKEGGESRECLEMALLEALARHGLQRCAYKKVKAITSIIWFFQKFLFVNDLEKEMFRFIGCYIFI